MDRREPSAAHAVHGSQRRQATERRRQGAVGDEYPRWRARMAYIQTSAPTGALVSRYGPLLAPVGWGHLTRQLFAAMLERIWALPVPTADHRQETQWSE